MKIKVTEIDIESGEDPIEFAAERAFGKHVTVDRKFLMVEGNRHPFRLPLSAELWYRSWYLTGKGKPFTFEINN
jgi:hypothetical protein